MSTSPKGWLAARWHSVHATIHHLSLRARLLVGLLLVAVFGFLVADLAVYGLFRSYINGQNASTLSSVNPGHIGVPIGCWNGTQPPPNSGAGYLYSPDLNTSPANSFIELTGLSGTFCASNFGPRTWIAVPSSVLDQLRAQAANLASRTPQPVRFNATATNRAGYAVQARLASLDGSLTVLVVAVPFSDISSPLHRLVLLEIVVSLGVLLLLVGSGYLVVRAGLRPLAEIEQTAGAIAAGDLSRRVELDDERIEIGRLGASLNDMLGQIEHAFSEQRVSEQRLRQFLADASHELRTPVTSIRGYAELFRRGAATNPSDLERSMKRIEDESIRMGVLVDDLLLLARLDEGRPLDRTPIALASIAVDAAADAQAQAQDREITVELDDSVTVLGDEPRLRQVLGNLLQNAIRYSPEGSPIEIALGRDGDDAVLVVTDHGIGITPEHLPHVFDRFYRADQSRARGSGGSGLGLAIVASIVEAHGGVVRVDSEVGRGTTFTLRLPLTSEQPADPAAPASPVSSRDGAVVDGDDAAPAQGTSETEVGTPGPLYRR